MSVVKNYELSAGKNEKKNKTISALIMRKKLKVAALDSFGDNSQNRDPTVL